MNKDDNKNNKFIDAYYDDIAEDKLFKVDHEDIFEQKLEKSMKKMNILNTINYETNVNLLDIILKGQAIKEKKTSRKELLSFLSTCILILTLVAFLAFTFSIKIIIYVQIIISISLPFLVFSVILSLYLKERLR